MSGKGLRSMAVSGISVLVTGTEPLFVYCAKRRLPAPVTVSGAGNDLAVSSATARYLWQLELPMRVHYD